MEVHLCPHVPIENTLVQHKMAKNSRMVLCCQNRVSKALTSVMCFIVVSVALFIAPLTVLGLLKKKKEKKKKELVYKAVFVPFSG